MIMDIFVNHFEPHIFRLPSACSKRLAVVKLFESIKSGVSQCHNTGNEKECSGKNNKWNGE